MKKRMIIESIRSAYGVPRGPAGRGLHAEAKVTLLDDKWNGESSYVALTYFDNFYVLFETEESIFDKLLVEDEEALQLALIDVEGPSGLKAEIADSPLKKVYELLYGLLDIPESDVDDLAIAPIPDDVD